MRIDVRGQGGDHPSLRTTPWLGRIDVDPNDRPNLVRLPAPLDDEVHEALAVPSADDRPLGGASAGEPTRPDSVVETERSVTCFLNWEGAIDDAGQLRKCVLCSCDRLYRRKVLPQVTPFVVILAFAGAVIGFLGYSNNPVVLPGLVALLVVDVATLGLAKERLVCYRCGSVYSKLPIARYHRRWNRTEAERVRARLGITTASSLVAAQPSS